MARLVHNDYLDQASDSGIPGSLLYATFIVVALGWTFRRLAPLSTALNRGAQTTRANGSNLEGWQIFAIWLGVLGWSLQSLLEFGLYLPALAWPALTLIGWLLGTVAHSAQHKPIDNAGSTR